MSNERAAADRRVAIWLLACCAAVFLTVVVGGVTRLTRSGLSIVEWNPVSGIVPPIGEAAWHAEFEKYKRTPEYEKVNRGMDLEGFKRIYRVEFLHRIVARGIGLVFLVPLVALAWRGDVRRGLWPRLVALFLLGGAQGGVGWFMVKSGLVDDPKVSPYRLTMHLGLAVLIFAGLLWVALDLLSPRESTADGPRRRSRLAAALAGLVFLMILTGGVVAGTRAGYLFGTFPLMMGHLVPPGLLRLDPWWVNFGENLLTVQFTHRALGALLCVAIPAGWLVLRRAPMPGWSRIALHLMPVALAVQVGLGVATLVNAVPLSLAVAHQAVALVVFTLALMVAHGARRAPAVVLAEEPRRERHDAGAPVLDLPR